MTPNELRELADTLTDESLGHHSLMDRAASAPADAVEALRGLTDRHWMVVRFALWRFINDAHVCASEAAQKGPAEFVAKFQDNAKHAEEVLAALAAADQPQQPMAEGYGNAATERYYGITAPQKGEAKCD